MTLIELIEYYAKSIKKKISRQLLREEFNSMGVKDIIIDAIEASIDDKGNYIRLQ
jgi:hypothetical protein